MRAKHCPVYYFSYYQANKKQSKALDRPLKRNLTLLYLSVQRLVNFKCKTKLSNYDAIFMSYPQEHNFYLFMSVHEVEF